MPQLHHSLQRKKDPAEAEMSVDMRTDVLGGVVRRPRERRKSDSASIMTADNADTKSVTGSQGGGSPSKEVSRVGSWATAYQKSRLLSIFEASLNQNWFSFETKTEAILIQRCVFMIQRCVILIQRRCVKLIIGMLDSLLPSSSSPPP